MPFTRKAIGIAVLLGAPTFAMAQPYYGYQQPNYQQTAPQTSPYNPTPWGQFYQPSGIPPQPPMIVYQVPRGNCGMGKPCEGGF